MGGRLPAVEPDVSNHQHLLDINNLYDYVGRTVCQVETLRRSMNPGCPSATWSHVADLELMLTPDLRAQPWPGFLGHWVQALQ